MNIVSRELGRIAQTVNRGVAGIGLSRLAGERSLRESARLDYDLDRNREYDERAGEEFDLRKIGLKRDAMNAEAEIRRGQQVSTWASESSDAFTAMMIAKVMPLYEGIYKGKALIKEGVFQGIQREDGSMVKEIDRDKPREAEALLATYKLSSTYKDQIARIEEKEQRLNEEGVPITDPAYGKLQVNKERAQSVLDSPEKMIVGLRRQLDQLSRHGHYPEAIKRIKGEINYERSKLMTPAQKLAEKRGAALHKETMALRKVQLATAKKALKGINQTIERKLPPGEKEKAKREIHIW